MAVHDLDTSRFLTGADSIDILAVGSSHIDKSIDGYDQRAKVFLGTKGMVATDINLYRNTAKIHKASFTGDAEMPYVSVKVTFCECLVIDSPVLCT